MQWSFSLSWDHSTKFLYGSLNITNKILFEELIFLAYWAVFLLHWIYSLIYYDIDHKFLPNAISDNMSKTMDFVYTWLRYQMRLYALYRISVTDTFILISSCFSSTTRCKESHFSMVHDWDSNRRQQEPCRHIWKQHLIYNHIYWNTST